MNFFKSVFSTDPDPDLDGEENATSSDHDEPDETAQAASAAAAAAADFFKSVFSTSPDPPEGEDQHEEEEEQPLNQEQDQQRGEAQEGEEREEEEGEREEEEEEEEEGLSMGPWGLGFGGLIKTFASRSETVIKDLEEFGHGLRAETVVLRDVASRALDVGASAAQEKLESMGQVKDYITGIGYVATGTNIGIITICQQQAQSQIFNE